MSTSLSKIYRILDLLEQYSSNTSEDNIRARLDKCLELYLADLNYSCNKIKDNINKKSVVKELNKC